VKRAVGDEAHSGGRAILMPRAMYLATRMMPAWAVGASLTSQ